MFLFSGRAKYVREHTSALPFLHTNHNPPLPAEQSLMPHSHHSRNKCTLIIPFLMPLEVFYQTQFIILSCMYFWLFPWQPTLCAASCHYFYTSIPLFDTVSGCNKYSETTSIQVHTRVCHFPNILHNINTSPYKGMSLPKHPA